MAIIVVAYSFAFSARSLTSPMDYLSSLDFILAIGIVTIFILYFFGVYHRIWSQTSGHGIRIFVQALFPITIILFLFDVSYESRPLPLSVLLLGIVLQFGGFIVVRYRSRLVGAFEWRWRAIWHREFPKTINERVLIVGAGESGQITALRLQHHFEDAQYEVTGFVDDDVQKQGMYVEGCKVLGVTDDIPHLVEEYDVDLIVVAIHRIDGQAFRSILEQCEQAEARVKIVPDILKFFNTHISNAFLRDVQPEDLLGRSTVQQSDLVDLSLIRRRVVLISGAAGSIGSELARQIAEYYSPQKLILLDNNESALHDLVLDLSATHSGLDLQAVLMDVTRKHSVSQLIAEVCPDVIFHAAAYKHVPLLEDHPDEAVRVNIGGTLNLAEAAIYAKVERFVLISTDKAVSPTSVMGATKRLCELVVQAFAAKNSHQTLFTSVRFGNVLGSRGSVVPIFNRQIDRGGPVTVTHPEMTRFFMSIKEAVNLVIHAAAMTDGGDLFLLKMGEVVRILDLAERMIRLRGLRPYRDIAIDFTGTRKGEKLHEELYSNGSEHLHPTAHPGIMRVNGEYSFENGRAFINHMHNLTENGITNAQELLEEVVTSMELQGHLFSNDVT